MVILSRTNNQLPSELIESNVEIKFQNLLVIKITVYRGKGPDWIFFQAPLFHATGLLDATQHIYKPCYTYYTGCWEECVIGCSVLPYHAYILAPTPPRRLMTTLKVELWFFFACVSLMGKTRPTRSDNLLTLWRICNCLTKEKHHWIAKSLHYRSPSNEFFVRRLDLGQNL